MSNGQVKELILYRLSQAEEMLEAAKSLAAAGISPRSVVNRAYYAMFYSCLAVLATINKGSAKHSGVISLFNLHFVKPDIFPMEFGRVLHNAFDLRQEADYGTDTVDVDQDIALEVLTDAEKFVTGIVKYLDGINLTK